MKTKLSLLFCLVLLTTFLPYNMALASSNEPSLSEYDRTELEKIQQSIDKKISKQLQNSDSDTYVSNGDFGTYPTRKGVILVTKDKYKGVVPTGHAAIVYNADAVVESLADGVGKHPNNWTSYRTSIYGVTPIATSYSQDAACADWCFRQIGKPYNIYWLEPHRRDMFYCSQLVWAAYKDLYGIDLQTIAWGPAIHPLELVESPLTKVIYSHGN